MTRRRFAHMPGGSRSSSSTALRSSTHNVNVENGEHELGKTATVTHATTTMFVTLKAGKYNFYCSVPGHEDAGMHGTLIVPQRHDVPREPRRDGQGSR